MTSWPSSSRSSTQMLPMYPAPPTTKIFIRGRCGGPCRCQKKVGLELPEVRDAFFGEGENHAANAGIFSAWREHLKAFFLRSPFDDVDIDRAHAPFPHCQTVRLVKVDRFRADEGAPVVVNLEDIVRPDDPKLCPERPARPIRCRAHHILAGKPRSNGVVAAAGLGMGIGG